MVQELDKSVTTDSVQGLLQIHIILPVCHAYKDEGVVSHHATAIFISLKHLANTLLGCCFIQRDQATHSLLMA